MYRILLVEDDSGIAQAICEQGAMWELDVRCVRNFHDVLGEFTAYDPQLVLMDISLPFFNGYHWCSEIRRVSRVPLIFLSSAADNMNIVMAMNMGAGRVCYDLARIIKADLPAVRCADGGRDLFAGIAFKNAAQKALEGSIIAVHRVGHMRRVRHCKASCFTS